MSFPQSQLAIPPTQQSGNVFGKGMIIGTGFTLKGKHKMTCSLDIDTFKYYLIIGINHVFVARLKNMYINNRKRRTTKASIEG